jgi:hypothetical protein
MSKVRSLELTTVLCGNCKKLKENPLGSVCLLIWKLPVPSKELIQPPRFKALLDRRTQYQDPVSGRVHPTLSRIPPNPSTH